MNGDYMGDMNDSEREEKKIEDNSNRKTTTTTTTISFSEVFSSEKHQYTRIHAYSAYKQYGAHSYPTSQSLCV